MEAASHLWEDSFPRSERTLTLRGSCWNCHGRHSPPGGAELVMQMLYEARGYPEAEVEEKNACSAPAALVSLAPDWKPQCLLPFS